MTRTAFKLRFALGVILCLAGCQSRSIPSEGFPVRGTLYIQGKPQPNVAVLFSPAGNPDERYAGCTDETGRFRLAGPELLPQVPTGTYQVALRHVVGAAIAAIPSPKLLADLPDAPNSVIPSEYSDLETTPLVVDVPSEDGRYDISIRSE